MEKQETALVKTPAAEMAPTAQPADVLNAIMGLPQVYCSNVGVAGKDRQARYSAMTEADERTADHVNKTVEVADILCHTVEIVDPETGQVTEAPRIVLITPDGQTFASVSQGVRASLAAAIAAYGPPTWAPALIFEPYHRKGKGPNKMLMLKCKGRAKVEEPKSKK